MIHWSGLSLSKMIHKWVLCNIIIYMSCKWQTHPLFPSCVRPSVVKWPSAMKSVTDRQAGIPQGRLLNFPKPLTQESQCRLQVGEANNFMTTLFSWFEHFQPNWLQNSCHVSDWRARCMKKSLNKSYHASIAFSPNPPHTPNLCTHPRATLGVHSSTHTPLFRMAGHRVWGDSCNAISTYPACGFKEKSARTDFFA